jgi:hypothetical protein
VRPHFKNGGEAFFMNEKLNQLNEIKNRLNTLWEKTEKLILRFFQSYESDSSDMSVSLPKMTDFNIIVAAIKRLQEARLELLKEELSNVSDTRTTLPDSDGAKEEISRVLEALEKNGCPETPDTDALPD